MCDGDIDPEWIESLNSVLDDNRLLTMPSGERIQFGPNVNFLFETHDLSCASPATISRMGMIFLRYVRLSAWAGAGSHCQLEKMLGVWAFVLCWEKRTGERINLHDARNSCPTNVMLNGRRTYLSLQTDRVWRCEIASSMNPRGGRGWSRLIDALPRGLAHKFPR